jgi:hypothetical protein
MKVSIESVEALGPVVRASRKAQKIRLDAFGLLAWYGAESAGSLILFPPDAQPTALMSEYSPRAWRWPLVTRRAQRATKNSPFGLSERAFVRGWLSGCRSR